MWRRRVTSDVSETASEPSPSDARGLTFVDRTERDVGGRLLIKERYRNIDGRLLILYQYASLNVPGDDYSEGRDG